RLHGLGDAVLWALAEAGQPPALKTLDLWDNHVSGDGVAALAGCPAAASLERLILGGSSNLAVGSVVPLAESPYFAQLQTLHLAFTDHLGDPDARALARSPHLGNLRSLDLRRTSITDEGEALLRERFGNAVHRGGKSN